MIPIADERSDGPVRQAHERTGRLHDVQAERACGRQRPLRRAVRRHHDRVRLHFGGLVRDGDAPVLQGCQHRRVVNQVAQDGERPGVRLRERQRDGVAHAEAHAEVFCADDLHRPGRSL